MLYLSVSLSLPLKAFPIVWSAITVLRAASTVLVYLRTNTLLCWPVFAMALHLSLGDTWNTINNVEVRRASFIPSFVPSS
jgi:tryptophan-rich sensory protein